MIFLYYNPAIPKTEYMSRAVLYRFLSGTARNRWTRPDESGKLRLLSGQMNQTPRGIEALTSSERVHPDCSHLNDTRSEDSRLVSQRIFMGLRQLCHSLLYITALKLCPMTFKARSDARTAVPDGAAAARFDRRSDERALTHALNLFSKVLLSLPAKETHVNSLSAIEVFVAKLNEEVLEFSARNDAADKPAAPRFGRKAEISRSPGLESLKVTLNLARGDLESSFAF